MSQVDLAKASGVPQTTISLILSPASRLPTKGRAAPSTTVERVSLLAQALGVEAWQLLHPDPEQARRETDFYRRIARDFERLTKPVG